LACNSDSTPTLVVMAGLAGAGKSTLARRLSDHLQWPIIDIDVIKTALLEEEFSNEVAGLATYSVSLAVCYDLVVRQHLSVILDSPARYPIILERARRIVEESNGTLRVIYCQVNQAIRNARLAQRKPRLSQIVRDETTDSETIQWFKHLPSMTLTVDATKSVDLLLSEAFLFVNGQIEVALRRDRYCWPIPLSRRRYEATGASRATRWERRVWASGIPSNQCATRTKLIAAAVRICWRWARS